MSWESEEGGNMNPHEMNYADLEANYNDDPQDYLDADGQEVQDDEDSPEKDPEIQEEESQNDSNDGDSDNDAKDEESDPQEDEEDNISDEDLKAELEKRDKIIAHQKKMIDKQSQEVGLSRNFRKNLPGFTEEERKRIEDAELDGGFLEAQKVFDEIQQEKVETYVKEQQMIIDRNAQMIETLCPDLDEYEAEIRQILQEEGVPEENINNAFANKGSSDPNTMAQIYKRAKDRRTYGQKSTRFEDLERENRELREALKTGNAEYLRKLEKKANSPGTIKAGSGKAATPRKSISEMQPHELSYDDLDWEKV